MPLYEFECLNCGRPFEELVRNSQAIQEVVCPFCGERHIRKKMSVFASTSKGMAPTSSSASSCSTGSV